MADFHLGATWGDTVGVLLKIVVCLKRKMMAYFVRGVYRTSVYNSSHCHITIHIRVYIGLSISIGFSEWLSDWLRV